MWWGCMGAAVTRHARISNPAPLGVMPVLVKRFEALVRRLLGGLKGDDAIAT